MQIMATSAKRENPERPEHLELLENSELEVMRAKIRKLEQKNFELEATVKTNEELLMFKDEELQMIKNDQVDLDHHEAQVNDVIDFLSALMNNPGFKRIADNLLSLLDSKSFNWCREVCRSWKNYIDNEWSMLQLQIFHLKRHQEPGLLRYDGKPFLPLLDDRGGTNFGSLFKIMENTRNKSELRAFIKMCHDLVSKYCSDKLKSYPLEYMIDHHRHQELKLLLHCPIQKNPGSSYSGFACFTRVFKYACQYGCQICVKLLLDRSEEKEIDLNRIGRRDDWEKYHNGWLVHEHCLFAANQNTQGFVSQGYFRKEVVDLLLRSAEEKGIDIHAKRSDESGNTLRDEVIDDFLEVGFKDYTEETYKILKIDQSDIC